MADHGKSSGSSRRVTRAGRPRGKKGPAGPPKSRLGPWMAVGFALLLVAYLGVLELSRPHVSGERLRFDQFYDLAKGGRVQTAELLDEDAYVVGTYTDDDGAVTRYSVPLLRGMQTEVVQLLVERQIATTVDQQVGKRIASLASVLLPGLLLTLLFVYLILSYRRGSGLFSVRSGAVRITAEDVQLSFADVAGQDAAVRELKEIKEFLADPGRFAVLGAAVPKGVLLYGPPGCGKTLLAKALAGEAAASFFSISGSDFVEVYVGVGASRVRELFREARANAPAVIFIDELDSIGRARGTTNVNSEQEQALNQVLAEMDGFSTSEGIVVLAATNRPDVLDQALLRPGRFDRSVGLERPDEQARLAILALHAGRKPLEAGADLADIARRAIGLTGADLASVLNEGALLAARAGKEVISQVELNEAIQRVLGAPERQRRLSMRKLGIGRRFSSHDRLSFADVAGVDDALAELGEIKDYLADPDRFARIGAQVPRGILLSGPPGSGKTMLARAVAGEANAAFFSVAASEFVEVFVGEGASRVRDLFAEARSVAPAIVFIDEIDAIGAHRGGGMDGGRDREQTLNQILVEMDGFEARSGVIVMAATNRPDILDPALVRAGRFDRHVVVSLPDRAGRVAILALHLVGKALGDDVDVDAVAAATQGFSGADLANVVNEAALLTARRGGAEVTMAALEEAVDRAMTGVASRGVVLSHRERAMVAFHTVGHTLVARSLPGAVGPQRLTIVGRGASFGACAMSGAPDLRAYSRSTLLDHLTVLVAGREAERMAFDDALAAGSGDLARAGTIARRMVCELGMSERLELLPYAYAEGAARGQSPYSDEAAKAIEAEVRRLLDEASERARGVLASSRETLDAISQALVERETLPAEELDRLLAARTRSGRRAGAGPAARSASR